MFQAVSRRDQPNDKWCVSTTCILPRWHRDILKDKETFETKLVELLGMQGSAEPSTRAPALPESVRLARFGSLMNKYKPFFDNMSRDEKRYKKALEIGENLFEDECITDTASSSEQARGTHSSVPTNPSSVTELDPLALPILTGSTSIIKAKNPLRPKKRGRPKT